VHVRLERTSPLSDLRTNPRVTLPRLPTLLTRVADAFSMMMNLRAAAVLPAHARLLARRLGHHHNDHVLLACRHQPVAEGRRPMIPLTCIRELRECYAPAGNSCLSRAQGRFARPLHHSFMQLR